MEVWQLKELKKKHSFKLVRGTESGSRDRGCAARWQLEYWAGEADAGRLGSSTFVCRWTRRNNWGAGQIVQSRAPAGKWSLKTSVNLSKNLWGLWQREKLHRTVCWRDPQDPRPYTNPPNWESAPERPNLLVGSRGSDWQPAKSQASGVVPSLTPPP